MSRGLRCGFGVVLLTACRESLRLLATIGHVCGENPTIVSRKVRGTLCRADAGIADLAEQTGGKRRKGEESKDHSPTHCTSSVSGGRDPPRASGGDGGKGEVETPPPAPHPTQHSGRRKGGRLDDTGSPPLPLSEERRYPLIPPGFHFTAPIHGGGGHGGS